MKTDYYCKSCDEFFREDGLPNINYTHECGVVAKVVWHERAKEG